MDEFCKNLPKVELHAHLNGSLSLETLKSLLSEQNLSTDIVDEVIISQEKNFNHNSAFKAFSCLHDIMNTKEIIKRVTKDVIADFANDNVRYLELRTTPRSCAKTGMTRAEYIDSVVSAIREAGVESSRIVVRLLLSIDRRQGVKEAMDTVNMAISLKHRTDGLVVGIDLSGDPTINNAVDFIPALKMAKENGLKLAVHLAEIPNPVEVSSLLEVGVDRIGHGTCLLEEHGGTSEIMSFVRTNRIPIEICLTCNKKCGSCTDLTEHHFKYWYKQNHPCVLCTDDKGVVQTSVSQEYALAARTFGLNKHDLWNLSYDSIDCCFLDDSIKKELQNQWLSLKEKLLGT